MAETEMCLPYTIEQLKKTVGDLAVSNSKLAQMQETLLQTEKMASMGQLAAGIAHELNNPLGVVLMYAHVLREEMLHNESLRDDLNMITEQAERCKTIVSGLLHFARQNKVVKQPVKVGEIVQKGLQSVIIPDNINVSIENDNEELEADLDRDQIIQVITNLVSNACGAMPEGGNILIHTVKDGDNLRIEIIDNGTGIPKENISKIFEPFFTTKSLEKGTGLGLAVSYGIIKLHSGDIKVESNANPEEGPTGTTFTITLPLKGVEAPAA
jgi:signal transduction histidine kinase